MITLASKTKCTGCGACCNICPKNAIEMQADNEGFLYPVVDETKCVDCGLCEKICPVMHPKSKDAEIIAVYGALHKDEKIRIKSSSGGVFTAIAEYILSKNGAVFGAAFSEDFKSVRHIAVESSERLELLRGSKYVQSDIGGAYKQAKHFLEQGRAVLFTGTPCQIGGLRAYLGKDYEKLYTQDLICHGVPSPAVWKAYAEHLERKYADKLYGVSFRNKKSGWKTYSVSAVFSDNAKYEQIASRDEYMRGFLSDIYLRPSCYACDFKGGKGGSDITLADFWGAEKLTPDLNDDKGISLLLVHTQKGAELFKATRNAFICKTVNLQECIAHNAAYTHSVKLPKARSKFFNDLKKDDSDVVKCIERATKVSFVRKSVAKVKSILKKIIKK